MPHQHEEERAVLDAGGPPLPGDDRRRPGDDGPALRRGAQPRVFQRYPRHQAGVLREGAVGLLRLPLDRPPGGTRPGGRRHGDRRRPDDRRPHGAGHAQDDRQPRAGRVDQGGGDGDCSPTPRPPGPPDRSTAAGASQPARPPLSTRCRSSTLASSDYVDPPPRRDRYDQRLPASSTGMHPRSRSFHQCRTPVVAAPRQALVAVDELHGCERGSA